MTPAAIQVGQLLQVVWVSLVAGVGVTAAYSLVVLGGARSVQAGRAGRSGAALAYGALAALCLVLVAAGVVVGVHIMLTKS
jgi:hypothetical protein